MSNSIQLQIADRAVKLDKPCYKCLELPKRGCDLCTDGFTLTDNGKAILDFFLRHRKKHSILFKKF
jgi:hypothetical protein